MLAAHVGDFQASFGDGGFVVKTAGKGATVIDRKISITFYPKDIQKVLRQSAVAAMNGYKIRWEVPNERQKRQAERLFKEWGIKNIEVGIHPRH